MGTRSTRLRRFVPLGAAVAIVASGIALAAGTASASRTQQPQAVIYRLTATLTPGQEVPAVQAPIGAVGHFHGFLFRTGIGTAKAVAMAGCKVVVVRHGAPSRIRCGATVMSLPAASGQWRLLWWLSVANLSGPATAADIHVNAPAGHLAAVAFKLCGPCASTTHGMAVVNTGQGAALSTSSDSYVNVDTAAHPSGEIRGEIMSTPLRLVLGR
jgi:CHRD domain